MSNSEPTGHLQAPEEKFDLLYRDVASYISEARARALRTIDREKDEIGHEARDELEAYKYNLNTIKS